MYSQLIHCFCIHRGKLAVLENQESQDQMGHLDLRWIFKLHIFLPKGSFLKALQMMGFHLGNVLISMGNKQDYS